MSDWSTFVVFTVGLGVGWMIADAIKRGRRMFSRWEGDE